MASNDKGLSYDCRLSFEGGCNSALGHLHSATPGDRSLRLERCPLIAEIDLPGHLRTGSENFCQETM